MTFFNILLWNTFSGKRKLFPFRFLFESTKIENASFPYKNAYQKLMLRQKEWWLQNGAITKNRILPLTTLFVRNFCFSLRTSYKKLIWCTATQILIFVLFVSSEDLFDGAFSLWVLLKEFSVPFSSEMDLGLPQHLRWTTY